MKKLLSISGLLLVLTSSPAMALATDSLIEGAKLCTKYLPRYEREYGIPTHLLSAIASTESGRYHQGLKIAVPWPWTINVEGKGYYFDSKAEAITAVRNYRNRGIKSIDVGCMQVNLMHHAQAFSSLEQAFEPQYNIAYAASFLRNLYEEDKSWKHAASAYHSKTPSRGQQYVGSVYDQWYTIVSKLREARLQAPAPDSFAQADAPAVTNAVVKHVEPAATRQVAALPEQRGATPAAYTSPRMNSISVTRQESKREHGIIVVRPTIKVVDEPATAQADAKVVADILTVAQAQQPDAIQEAKIVRLDNAVARTMMTTTPRASGPRFIFEN